MPSLEEEMKPEEVVGSNQSSADVIEGPPSDVPSGAKSGRLFLTSFLDHLLRNNIVTEEIARQVVKRKHEQNGRGRRSLVDMLVNEFGISRDTLHTEVAHYYSFRVIVLQERSARRLPPGAVNKLLETLPDQIRQLAMAHKVLPYEVAENQPDKILVVTPNPSDREVYDVARSFPYKKFEICFMRENDWAELWRQVTLDKQHAISGMSNVDGLFEEDEIELDTVLDKEINRSQLIALVENVLSDAVRLNASDIHIVPRGARKTDILFRIDGQLTLWYSIEDTRAEAVVAVAKGRGTNLDRFERMAAQDGAAQKVVDDQIIRFRMSVLPVISREMGGKFESVVIRILRDADASATLDKIGFDPYSLRVFSEAIEKPHGMVILTGPTGSGKSTTLIAALRSVMNPTLNTITVEDPVEYILEGARQVKLNHKLTFDDAIRAILRHDPDIVMVGEIRDRVTADIAVKLANTGHLTFSTLHTNDAPSVIARLFKIGIEPFLLAQALNIVVAQRLVRKLCENCRVPVSSMSDVLLARAGFTLEEADQTQFYSPMGCVNCVGGFKGRTAIHESLFITQEIRDIIFESGERIDTDAIRQASIRHGMQSLRRSGIELVKKGITTVDEIIATTAND